MQELEKMTDQEYLDKVRTVLRGARLPTDRLDSILAKRSDKSSDSTFTRYTAIVADEAFNPVMEDGLPMTIGKSGFTLEGAKQECQSHRNHSLSTGNYLIRTSNSWLMTRYTAIG